MNVGTEDTIKENKNVDQSYMGSGPLSYTTPFTAVVPSFLSTPLLLLFLVVQPYTMMPNHMLHGPDCLVMGFYIVLWISSCLNTSALCLHVFRHVNVGLASFNMLALG